jgi:hypothetical protein
MKNSTEIYSRSQNLNRKCKQDKEFVRQQPCFSRFQSQAAVYSELRIM